MSYASDLEDAMSVEELEKRYLKPTQAMALREYIETSGHTEQIWRMFITLTGRGYTPPMDVAGWERIASVILPILEEE